MLLLLFNALQSIFIPKVSAAHTVKMMGFDDTIKLQNQDRTITL